MMGMAVVVTPLPGVDRGVMRRGGGIAEVPAAGLSRGKDRVDATAGPRVGHGVDPLGPVAGEVEGRVAQEDEVPATLPRELHHRTAAQALALQRRGGHLSG